MKVSRPASQWPYDVRLRACKLAGISVSELLAGRKSRRSDLVAVRMRICAEIVERGGSMAEAGYVAGFENHSSVFNACRRFDARTAEQTQGEAA